MAKKEIPPFLKKNWLVILAFTLIFALLLLAYVIIENYDPTKGAPVATPTPQISMLSVDASLVSGLEMKNANGTYNFVKNENGWMIKNQPYIELIRESVDSLVYSAATLSATKLIVTECTDMEAYGLEKPQATVKLSTENGAEHIFHIGSLTPSGDGYYASLDKNRDVYMLSAATGSQFCVHLDSFRSMTITDIMHTQIRNVSIKKDGNVIRLRYVAPPEGAYPGSVSTWQMETPLDRPCGNDAVLKQILSPLSNIVAVAIAEDNPKDMSKYGFGGNTVTFTTDTEEVSLLVGLMDGVYYVKEEGKSPVYLVGSSLPFMEVTPFDLVEKETNLIPLDTVSKIELNLGSVSATLQVEGEGDNLSFLVDGKKASVEKSKYLYMEIAGLSVDGIAKVSGKNTGTPSASILYTLNDGSTTTLSYYPYDSFNYALYENGECTFYIKKTRISNLADSLQKFVHNPN